MPLNPERYRSAKALSIKDLATRMAFEDMAQRLEQLARDANGLGGGGDAFPAGAVVMWFGAEADIPAGWSVYEPARGKFFRMIASGGTPGATGGSVDHLHEVTGGTMGTANVTVGVAAGGSYNVANGNHTHSYTDYTSKASNYPPYIDGILIQKD